MGMSCSRSLSLALSLISLMVFFVTLMAAYTAVRVLRYWDINSDSARQIRLENEIWLSSTLMEYALVFQILSLFLLVLAADSFSTVLIGAMYATGSFLANGFGIASLCIKLVSIFVYGFWLFIHRLDISSCRYPLVRLKYFYLLALCPFLITDILLQTLYLSRLQPDSITSCCGVVFQEMKNIDLLSLSAEMAGFLTTLVFYCMGVFLIGLMVFFKGERELTQAIDSFQSLSLKVSVAALVLFVSLCSLYPVLYYMRGGEV